MNFLNFSIFLINLTLVLCEHECQDEIPYHSYLGTKTPYRYIVNMNDSKIQFPSCRESQIWMIIRHGTRYPGTKKIKKMDEVLPRLRNEIIQNYDEGTLCNEELELFKKWKLYPQLADDKNLAHEGEDEMIDLAERMQNRFPDLFPEEYDNNTYYFRYTATERCTESARHFAIGLFGRKVSRYVWFPDPVYKDPILRFYKLCDKWKTTVKKNAKTYDEAKQFEHTTHVQNVQENVTKRLGLSELISVETLKLVYSICGFETAWSFRQKSAWCSVFSENDLRVMEYLEDLKFYWVDGHGHKLTTDQACPVIRDIYNFFDSNTSGKTVVYFAHSGTLLKIFGHLGLFADSHPLKHDNYEENINRNWKVSKIDAFASNLAFVLFECEDGKKIMVMHQERQIYIPGCPENDLCPLETFKQIFNNSIHNCDFEEMCSIEGEKTIP